MDCKEENYLEMNWERILFYCGTASIEFKGDPLMNKFVCGTWSIDLNIAVLMNSGILTLACNLYLNPQVTESSGNKESSRSWKQLNLLETWNKI